MFTNQLEMLPVLVQGHEAVTELLESVESFRKDATKLLEMAKPDAKDVEKCVEIGTGLDVELPELARLKTKLKTTEWLEEVTDLLDDPQNSSFEQLKEAMEAGKELAPEPAVEKALGEISGLLSQGDMWEVKAKACLAAKPRWVLQDVEKLVREGESISGGLPSLSALREAVRKARDWRQRSDAVRSGPDTLPYLETLEALVAKGRPLPVRLEALSHLETQVASARAWRERTARVFLKKNSHLTLLDVLCPRVDVSSDGSRKKRRSVAPQVSEDGAGIVPHPIFSHMTAKDLSDPQNFVKAFKEAEKEEIEVLCVHSMNTLININLEIFICFYFSGHKEATREQRCRREPQERQQGHDRVRALSGSLPPRARPTSQAQAG